MLRQNLATILFTSLLCGVVSYLLNSYTSVITPYWYWSLLFLGIFSFVSNLYYERKFTPEKSQGTTSENPANGLRDQRNLRDVSYAQYESVDALPDMTEKTEPRSPRLSAEAAAQAGPPRETKHGSDFASLLMTGVIIRLLLSMVYLLVAWLLLRPSFLGCAVHFLLHYTLFSVAEIRYLSLLVKSRQAKP